MDLNLDNFGGLQSKKSPCSTQLLSHNCQTTVTTVTLGGVFPGSPGHLSLLWIQASTNPGDENRILRWVYNKTWGWELAICTVTTDQ